MTNLLKALVNIKKGINYAKDCKNKSKFNNRTVMLDILDVDTAEKLAPSTSASNPMKLYKNIVRFISSLTWKEKSFAIEVPCTHKYMKYKD